VTQRIADCVYGRMGIADANEANMGQRIEGAQPQGVLELLDGQRGLLTMYRQPGTALPGPG